MYCISSCFILFKFLWEEKFMREKGGNDSRKKENVLVGVDEWLHLIHGPCLLQ